ncbi:MAG: ribulose-phosphate 3-epimerase [Clostridia bacterium]|nr:ribulose-phosphate 3-epimerase [Clostridia bacterium]
MRRIKLSPSALSCDFAAAGGQIKQAAEGGAEYLHLDVMDGVFVPNISFGQPVVKSLRKCTDLVFDVHLMITEPIRYIEDFAKAGADIITVHYEACSDVEAALLKIRACGKKCGISVKPGTPAEVLVPYLPVCDLVLVMTVEPGFGGQKFMPDMLPKVRFLRDHAEKYGLNYQISVDGGVSASNAALCTLAGANVLVAGSSVMGKEDVKKAAEELLAAANMQAANDERR